jgi:hypothetical protein
MCPSVELRLLIFQVAPWLDPGIGLVTAECFHTVPGGRNYHRLGYLFKATMALHPCHSVGCTSSPSKCAAGSSAELIPPWIPSHGAIPCC